MSGASENLALAGLKVADFSWAAAAPIATRMMADHGATVVRVESSVHIDTIRITGPFRDDKPGLNKSGFFAEFNGGKYGLALNLELPDAHEVAKRLVTWADVVVESFTPRVMAKWKLSYQDIVRWKPDTIMLSSCMQGQTGPYRDYAGFGGQGAAIAGLHELTGWSDLPPAGPKGAYTDTIAPRYTLAALMAAIDYRDRTGIGQHIDLSQIEAAITGFMTPAVLDYEANGHVAGRMGNRSLDAAPHGSFPCAGTDRWITIAIQTDRQWASLRAAMGDPSWASDDRFATVAGRLAAQDEIDLLIGAWTRAQEPFALLEQLQVHGIPSGVVQNAADLFADPQLIHLGHFQTLDHVEMGSVAYNGAAHRLSECPSAIRWAAPRLGEHSHQVLRDLLGYSDREIDDLASCKILE